MEDNCSSQQVDLWLGAEIYTNTRRLIVCIRYWHTHGLSRTRHDLRWGSVEVLAQGDDD